jgi:hypothetical protein
MGGTYFLRIFEFDGKVFAKISKRLKKDTQIRFGFSTGRLLNGRPKPTKTYREEFVLYRANTWKQLNLLRHEQSTGIR